MELSVTTTKIRKLLEKDVSAIRGIYTEIIQEPAGEDFDPVIKSHAQREDDVCLVAEVDGMVVGFLVSYILTMGFGISKSALIATLGVDPKYMGQGIGGLMIKEIFHRYKALGIKDVYTSVRLNATDLMSFFDLHGFNRSNFINLHKVLG